ncbi:disease resistance RPP13-like protein 1 [Canna indica]|uniref:Disease resistance RPP13-like protein 1 n=1 Tax=Canna indica TaxID=4628 RepID=A0AAQ3KGY4_9LILI|nr:disease resistance RPP13-like protein 1 [Canna indica]
MAWGNLSSRLLTVLSTFASAPSSSSAQPPSPYLPEQELRSLKQTMLRIQAELADAEKGDIRECAVKHRLSELKHVAYDAEDVVDLYDYEVLRAKIECKSMKGKQVEVCDHSSTTSHVPAYTWRRDMERDDETTRLRVNRLSSLVDESEILGREKEKEDLVDLLLMKDDDTGCRGGTTLTVIPVICMGGFEKTTLAQLVYNNPRVCENFKMKGWVFVSEDFNIVSLTRKILESFTGNKYNHTELNELQLALCEKVQGEKFLLVMDDVWNENYDHWESLKQPLLSSGVDPNNVHRNLEEIGMEIVRKCNGLPLAVKVLGSALRYEDDTNSWTDILESELWEQDEGITGQILPALKISYDCMPRELKISYDGVPVARLS